MDTVSEILEKYIKEDLELLVASNPSVKAEGLPAKLRVRPVMVKRQLRYQITRTVGTKEIHENFEADAAVKAVMEMVEHAPGFKQLEMRNATHSATVLISKKGHVTVKERKVGAAKLKQGNEQPISAKCTPAQNRRKQYLIPEGEPVDFLVELGVTNKDGYIVKARYDKFRQINRFLEFVRDIADELASKNCLNIIDFGCGRSYLTFALYWYLHKKLGMNVNITGLDLKQDVIDECSQLADRLGYTGLKFLHGDIADYETKDRVDMVVTLHACDTATDYALYNAVRWGARVILSVPCCQHELNGQIKGDMLAPVIRYGLIKERMSALITDALRADMLEEQGYKVQILEFIDMEHTPKNILIRAVKTYPKMQPSKKLTHTDSKAETTGSEGTQTDAGNRETDGKSRKNSGENPVKPQYTDFMDSIGADLTLYRLLQGETSQAGPKPLSGNCKL